MIQEKITFLKAKQKEIIELNHFFEEKKKQILEEFDSKKSELEKTYQDKINAASFDLMKATETYRAEVKTWIGITDGEKINILDTVNMILKVIEMAK